MDLFRPRQQRSSLLAQPRTRGMSNTVGDRLSTIEENPIGLGISKNAANHSAEPGRSRSSTLPRVSAETRPPSYKRGEWQPGSPNFPEKSSFYAGSRRGGWGRCAIIAAILFLVIVALAVGLGVGLTRRHSSSSSSTSAASQPAATSGTDQGFPLGEYTFVTALQDVQTSCTSNSATWRCYPYSTYDGANSTSGLTLYNWVLSSSATSYASNATTLTTDSAGVPANITLSSTTNPFAMTIISQNLTYINNDTSPRLTFSFTYSQSIVPTTSLDANNTAATCIYNSTLVTATLYLSDTPSKTYPGSALADSSSVNGGYTSWPYAVEILESASGGTNVPTCYETTNGVLGAEIGSFTAESDTATCQCLYSNY